MAFSKQQLKQAKDLLDSGKFFIQMKEDLGITDNKDIQKLRQEMNAEFGADVINAQLVKLRGARQPGIPGFRPTFDKLSDRVGKITDLTNAEIDTMVTNLQATISQLNSMRK